MTTLTETPNQTRLRWLAWGIAFLLFTGICIDVAHKPTKHTTMPTYRYAATQWWQGNDPYSYNNHDAFLYFPQAAVIFTPFNILPSLMGDILWRAATFGLFFYALIRLYNLYLSKNNPAPGMTFLALCLLAIPSSMASIRNAQFDLPLAALIVLAAVEIATQRWNAAAFWLCFAVALKPLAVVPLLLFTALYWKLIPRIVIGMLIVLLLPFLHWNPVFVAHEYVRCVETLIWASKGDEPRYSDLAALVSKIGIDPSHEVKTVLRAIFALVYLGLGYAAVRRLKPIEAAWMVGALSADYLMLFNPRTETCSYVFLGPWVASLALLYMSQESRRWFGYVLAFAALGFACDAIPGIHGLTDRWYKPFLALLFFPVLIEFIFRSRRESTTP